jgi:hypothetical protein
VPGELPGVDGLELAVAAGEALDDGSELDVALDAVVVPPPQAESSSAADAPAAERKTRETRGFLKLTISLASLCWVTTVQWTCGHGAGLRRDREFVT